MSEKIRTCMRWGPIPSATSAMGENTWPATAPRSPKSKGMSFDCKGGKAQDYKGSKSRARESRRRETTPRARARATRASAETAGRSDTRRTSALRRGLRTRSRRRSWRRRMMDACGWSGKLRCRP